MSILPELVAYLRRPVFTASHVPMNGQALAELFKLLGITLVLALLSVMITSGLYSAVSGDTPEVSQDFEALTKSGQLFFMAVIYAPLTEELLFRSWLGRRWGLLFVMPLILALSAALALSGQSEAAPDMSAISIIIVMGSLGFYLQRYFSTKRMEGLHNPYEQLCRDRVSAFASIDGDSAIYYWSDIRLCAYALWPTTSHRISRRL